MALFNYATKEITLKIVYYGPGLSGKTTNLQHLHSILNPSTTGKLLSLSTEADRTLFFDFLPVELGRIRDFSIRFQLYTVPGQVRYNATRRVVLKGADAVIFVADSQRDMREQNIESFDNMLENLQSNNLNPDEIPLVVQYNKRDLSNLLTVEELNADLNRDGRYPVTEAVAISGGGVEDTYKLVTKLLLRNIANKHKVEIQPVPEKADKPVHEQPVQHRAPSLEPETAPASQRAAPVPVAKAADSFALPAEALGTGTSAPAPPDATGGGASGHAVEREIPGQSFSSPPPHSPASSLSAEDIFPDVRKGAQPSSRETAHRSSAEDVRPPAGGGRDISEAPVMPAEKFDEMNRRLDQLTGLVTEMRETLAMMRTSVSALSPVLKDAREIRREQGEMSALLKNLAGFLHSLKEKKSWFRF